MTQTSHSNKMTKHEFEFLTGSWSDVKGAAYNATYEFCREFGWCDRKGNVTDLGAQALRDYGEAHGSDITS